MGIFIYLSVSKSVSQAAWEPVYREALALAQQLGLAEYRRQEICGVPIWCLSVTEERTTYFGFEETRTWTGFDVDGDYTTMETSEKNGFPKELIGGAASCSEPADAMLETYLAANEDKEPHEYYSMLDGKTQGYAHHIPLLAVCCLIVDRLADQAYVYGDITAGQCRNAVKLANKYLDRPISLPDYCDPKRMALRLKRLSLSVDQAFDLLDWAYLGNKDSALGAEMRQSYGAEDCCSEWEKRLQPIQVGTAAFARVLTDYLNMGFDLERLC